jgi:FixJ family two-component response regulator
MAVLVVDDDPAVRLSCGLIFKRAGFFVMDACCADQALEIWSEAPRAFDVLVTDFDMPGLTGIELAQMLCEKKPGLGVVLISGLMDEQTPLPPRVHFLRKPFSTDALVNAVKQSVAWN